MTSPRVVLVTGGARRIGAEITRVFHGHGFQVVVHYNHSDHDAKMLCDELNALRKGSACLLQQDLMVATELSSMMDRAIQIFGRLDVLVNNASNFFPTSFGQVSLSDWNALHAVNLLAPFMLSQAAFPFLKKQQGAIVNITDANERNAMPDYSVYSIAKAGLSTMTRVLANEMAPDVRVNAVAPGVNIAAEGVNECTPEQREALRLRIPLRRFGEPIDIAKAVYDLSQSSYITGQVLAVDGGFSD